MARRLSGLPTTLILILGIFACSLNADGTSVAAQESTPGFTMSVEPGTDPATTERGYFVYTLAAKDSETGQLRLTNPTEKELVVDLSAVDAITANTGGSAFPTDEVKPTAVGTWLTLDETTVTIPPGEDRLVEFDVRVPNKTAPGQYLAGLAATEHAAEIDATPTSAESDQAAASIDVRTRYVIGVQVDVEGDWEASLQIDRLHLIEQPSGSFLGIDLRNDGNIFLKPQGSIRVTDDRGSVVVDTPIQMGTFITGTAVTLPIAWPGGPKVGTYSATVELMYGDDQTVTYDGTFTVGDDVATVAVSRFEITEVRDPASDDLQYVTIDIAIDNPATEISNARLTLHITRDGAPVEDVVLASSLTIQRGLGEISQRYFPPTGWDQGTYEFGLTIETVDPNSGDAIVILSTLATTPIVVD